MDTLFQNKDSLVIRVLVVGFFISVLILGTSYIGPLSIRNYFVFGLLVYSLIKYKRITINKVETLYFLYLFVLLCCTALRGQLNDETFSKDFLTFHIASVIIIIGVPILISTKKRLLAAINALCAVYVINLVLSILQYMHFNFAWEIASKINSSGAEKIQDSDLIGSKDDLLGRSVIQGVFGFVVTNGYIVASYLPLGIYKLFSAKSKFNLYEIVILILGFLGAFAIQQRMCFIVLCVFILILLWVKTKSVAKFFIFSLIIICLPFLLDVIVNIDFGRLTVTEDNYREQTFNVLSEVFQSKEWLLGCDINNVYKILVIGHNSIFDSLRRGGIITFGIYVVLLIVIVKSLYVDIKKFYKVGNFYACACGTTALIYIIYSMTHSTGIQSGAPYFWIPYTLMIASDNIFSKAKSTGVSV